MIIKYLIENGEIDAYNEELLSKLKCDKRTFFRYLVELEKLFPDSIKTRKDNKKSIWYLEWVDAVLKEFLLKNSEINWFMQFFEGSDNKILSRNEKRNLNSPSSKTAPIYQLF